MRRAAIVFLATLVLAACGIPTTNTAPAPATNTPADTARTYFTALKQGDCQTVIGLLSAEFKTRLGGDPGVNQWCTIATQHADIVPASDVTVLTPQMTAGDRASVPVTFTNAASSVQREMVETIKVGNSWKVHEVIPAGQTPSPSPSP